MAEKSGSNNKGNTTKTTTTNKTNTGMPGNPFPRTTVKSSREKPKKK
jgi:hypothetical protein